MKSTEHRRSPLNSTVLGLAGTQVLAVFHYFHEVSTEESMSGQKQNALVAFLCFNITVVVYQFVFNSVSGEVTAGGIFGRMFVSIVVGAVVGAIAWGICAVVNK